MKIMFLVVLAVAASLLLSACGGAAPSTPNPPGMPAPAEAPKEYTTSEAHKLYDGKCGSCHSPDGRGGSQFGAVTSSDLRQGAIEPKYNNDVALLNRAIMDGIDASGAELDASMLRYRSRLSEAEVEAIINFVLTLQ